MKSSANRRKAHFTTDDTRWATVQARDPAADGQFVYAVKTTGIYCRPTSSARLPKRKNVKFFETPQAAEAAGYRASRRATADQTAAAVQRATLIASACHLIEQAETPPNLEELAAQVGISTFHFHRVFKAETGLTPKAYASAFRARRLREELDGSGTCGGTITEAIYGAGFNSNSRFYETSEARLGMRPRDYPDGGRNAEIHFAVGQCSLGAILLGDDPDKLVRNLQDRFPKARLLGGDDGFEQLIAQVVGFIEAPVRGLHLPLDVRGTAFQERVWQALREIPPGAPR